MGSRPNRATRTLEPSHSMELMGLAHPPPLAGAGRGGGSRGPRRLSRAPLIPYRAGRRDPLLDPPPQGGRRRVGPILPWHASCAWLKGQSWPTSTTQLQRRPEVAHFPSFKAPGPCAAQTRPAAPSRPNTVALKGAIGGKVIERALHTPLLESSASQPPQERGCPAPLSGRRNTAALAHSSGSPALIKASRKPGGQLIKLGMCT